MFNRIKSGFLELYHELLAVNEAPSRIALSFALGVFFGILPFTGVAAAVAVAWIFRLNKPVAILGSAITNTWVGFLVFGVTVKIGGLVLGLSAQEIQMRFSDLWQNFHWYKLTQLSFLELVGAVCVGFIIVSFLFALASYFLALGAIYWHRSRTGPKKNS